MNNSSVGILSAAYFLPQIIKSIEDVFLEEEVELTNEIASQIGIERIHVFEDSDPTVMALESARIAIEKAGLSPSAIDVIIDFSILPQKYVVPAWSMSNEIQYKLSAKNAFTLGFSGGGSTNFHVALGFATSLILTDSNINTILMVGSDVAIAKNRILNRESPATILSDGSSAVILQRGVLSNAILDTCLSSDGNLNDVSYIQGGAMAHPDRLDLYRMTLSHEKLSAENIMTATRQLTDKILLKHSLRLEDIKHFLFPNISQADQKNYIEMFGINNDICAENLTRHGHIQASDFVLNYIRMQENVSVEKQEPMLMISHGMGFLSGVALLRH